MDPIDRSALPRELRPFIDEQGRLARWPSRQKVQRQALALLASHFEPGRTYTEQEVNHLLLAWHGFGDWAMLRRLLCDWKHLERESDGSAYRLRADRPQPLASDQPAAG